MVACVFRIVGDLVLPDIESLVLIVWLSFTLFDRLFQPLWLEDGFLILG